MRILVTNDDGINAPGLDAAARIAAELSDDVWVVAPEYDQSGVAHSLSLNDPLRLRQVGERRYAVKGTPTDCVILGVRHLLAEHRPDLVISGVNRGQNIAEDVTYSGTVAGAIEGSLLGIASIALSQAYGSGQRETMSYDCAEAHGAHVIRGILDSGIGAVRVNLFNVNFPPVPAGNVAGIAVTRQGQRPQGLARLDERRDGRGNPYFWIVYGHDIGEPSEDSDLGALRDRKISVTPLRIDMTDESLLIDLNKAFSGR